MTNELIEYLQSYVQGDEADRRVLTTMCSNYVYATGINCCTGFDLDPRFAEMNHAKLKAQITERTTEMAKELEWVAGACEKAGSTEKARTARLVALDFLREDDRQDTEDYAHIQALVGDES